MFVAEILRGKPDRLIGLEEGRSLADAAQLLTRERIGALIVRNAAGEMIGILSERDIVRAVAKDGPSVLERPVSSIMTKDVICVTPEDQIAEVMSLMTDDRRRGEASRRGSRGRSTAAAAVYRQLGHQRHCRARPGNLLPLGERYADQGRA
jgi:CBS domain-containing protein